MHKKIKQKFKLVFLIAFCSRTGRGFFSLLNIIHLPYEWFISFAFNVFMYILHEHVHEVHFIIETL